MEEPATTSTDKVEIGTKGKRARLGSLVIDLSDPKYCAKKKTNKKIWLATRPKPESLYGHEEWLRSTMSLVEMIRDEPKSYPQMPIGRNSNIVLPMKPLQRDSAVRYLVLRYIRYIRLAFRFDECYEHLIQPQKRQMTRRILESMFLRILEIKSQLMEIDMREFFFMERELEELNITPEDIELRVPTMYKEECSKRVMVINESVHSSIKRLQRAQRQIMAYNLSYPTQISKVLKFTINERSSQDAAKFKNVLKAIEGKNRLFKPFTNKVFARARANRVKEQRNMLVIKFARKWRRRTLHTKHLIEKREKMVDLKMELPGDETLFSEQLDNLELNKEIWQKTALINEKRYNEEYEACKNNMLAHNSKPTIEDLKMNIKQWMLEMKDLTGEFPIFPEPEIEGSKVLFQKRIVEEFEEEMEEYIEASKREELKKSKMDKKQLAEAKLAAKDKEKEQKKKEKEEQKKKIRLEKERMKAKKNETTFLWLPPESNALNGLKSEADEFADKWYYKLEDENCRLLYDKNFITDAIKDEMFDEIRTNIDELMKYELDRFIAGIEKFREKVKKPKKEKDPKKGKKGKKGRKGKKKDKDLTSNRSLESLYKQLVSEEILKVANPFRIKEFLGEPTFSRRNEDYLNANPFMSYADIRRVIMELCVLPLCSDLFHQNVPLTKALLIAGYAGTGKKCLVEAICNEVGALLFDLTPASAHEFYSDVAGIKLLIHMVMKVGRAFAPAVIWIGECERLFLKKKDKKDESKPHKWAKFIVKAIKTVKQGDRLMFIGTTSRPYLAKMAMVKNFERVIAIQKPDYATRRLMWQNFMTLFWNQSIPLDMDISGLSQVSKGFTGGDIINTCRDVLSKRRVRYQAYKPITTNEFAYNLAMCNPVYKAEEDAFLKWYNSMPLPQKRLETKALEDRIKELLRNSFIKF